MFPTLINLAQKHLNKLNGGLAAYYEKRLAELHSLITETLPTRMTLDEQSAFQIRYYHETQNRYDFVTLFDVENGNPIGRESIS